LQAQAIVVFGAPEDTSRIEDVFSSLSKLNPDSLQSYLYHPVPGSPWWRKFGLNVDLASVDGWAKLDFHAPLATAASEDEHRDALARFLASLVWTRDPVRPAVARLYEQLKNGFVCPRCAAEVRPRLLSEHDNVIVLSLGTTDDEWLIAASLTDIVAHPVRSDMNIHANAFWATDFAPGEALIRLCYRCGILPAAFSTSISGEITIYGEGETAFTSGTD
jgi:hypothetical protein